jgi:uncharacterized membrane protein YfcA
MDMLVIIFASFVVSILTFFSGFGLGTLLLPAFALFVPVELAVAATAVVHFANNLFKAALVGKHADRQVLIKFIVPAAICSFLGAALLIRLGDIEPLSTYTMGGREYEVTLVKLVIAALMIIFALFDLIPAMSKMAFPPRLIPLGGALSGFVGGLSGHQGALRAAVLIRLGLSKEAFIGTAVLCAVAVDFVRLGVYGVSFLRAPVAGGDGIWPLILAGTIAAFAGSLIGNKLLKKVTLPSLHLFIGVMILLLALALAAGFV